MSFYFVNFVFSPFQFAQSESYPDNNFPFTRVRNEPEPSSSTLRNDTETTVEETDHSIGTPFIISIWILSASIAKIGKKINEHFLCFYSFSFRLPLLIHLINIR